MIDNLALDGAARRVGDRWSLRLIGALLDGDRTFTELAGEVDGIAPNILTSRLRSLQQQALVSATPYERRPVRMRYSLTEPGRRLGTAISSLAEWGAHREGRTPARVHMACGSPVEMRPWCSTCEQVVGDDHDELIWC